MPSVSIVESQLKFQINVLSYKLQDRTHNKNEKEIHTQKKKINKISELNYTHFYTHFQSLKTTKFNLNVKNFQIIINK